jgi:predicted Zn-dependent protease
VDLIDDPFRIRGLGSTPFDDEGVAVSRQSLVRDGVLTTWLLNSSAAAQLGLASTGHASRGLATRRPRFAPPGRVTVSHAGRTEHGIRTRSDARSGSRR